MCREDAGSGSLRLLGSISAGDSSGRVRVGEAEQAVELEPLHEHLEVHPKASIGMSQSVPQLADVTEVPGQPECKIWNGSSACQSLRWRMELIASVSHATHAAEDTVTLSGSDSGWLLMQCASS